MQPRGHGNHHEETPMEMNRVCPTKRHSFNKQRSSALHPRRQEKEGETKKIKEKDSGEQTESHAQTWGSVTRLAQDRQEWRKIVALIHTTRCKGQ